MKKEITYKLSQYLIWILLIGYFSMNITTSVDAFFEDNTTPIELVNSNIEKDFEKDFEDKQLTSFALVFLSDDYLNDNSIHKEDLIPLHFIELNIPPPKFS